MEPTEDAFSDVATVDRFWNLARNSAGNFKAENPVPKKRCFRCERWTRDGCESGELDHELIQTADRDRDLNAAKSRCIGVSANLREKEPHPGRGAQSDHGSRGLCQRAQRAWRRHCGGR